MRYTTAGESHGRALSAIVTGVPAAIPIDLESINADLARRQGGYGRGGRQKIESDKATVLSGVRFGLTIGSPVGLTISNRDSDNWTEIMAPFGVKPEGLSETAPRPGHADLSGILKIGSEDCRDVLERASARETAARVAAGGIAKALLAALGVEVFSYVEAIGDVQAAPIDPSVVDRELVESSDVRSPDADASALMRDAIDSAREAGESLGGVFCVVANGLVPGLGSYAEASRRLDADLAAGVISIPAIKGVEFGDGFAGARRLGSTVHDEIVCGATGGYARASNHAGGLEGGMTTGEALVVRAAMKPIPTLMKPLRTVDIRTGEAVDASKERSDVCAVPAAAVVGEAEVAFSLCRAYLDKFGRDSLPDILAGRDAYLDRIGS
jgi:chorismate synthase